MALGLLTANDIVDLGLAHGTGLNEVQRCEMSTAVKTLVFHAHQHLCEKTNHNYTTETDR